MVPVLPVALSIAAQTRRWLRSRPGVSIGLPVPIESSVAPPEQLTEQLRATVEKLLEDEPGETS